jgi:hypothetical protein
MARKAPKNRMSMGLIGMPEQDKHEKMLSSMHDALYSLGNKIHKAPPREGDKLLPKDLRQEEGEDSKVARKHIERLHSSMKDCKS